MMVGEQINVARAGEHIIGREVIIHATVIDRRFEILAPVVDEIVCNAGPVVGQRPVGEDGCGHFIDRRYRVVQVRQAGRWILDRRDACKVSGPLHRRRHRINRRGGGGVYRVLKAEEEEKPVLQNRSADRASRLVVKQRRSALGKEVSGVQHGILKIFKERTVEVIVAAFGDDIQDRRPGSVFRVEVVFEHVEFADGAQGWNQRHEIVAVGKNAGASVYAGDHAEGAIPIHSAAPGVNALHRPWAALQSSRC